MASKGPPRFTSPIAADKIRRAPAPPTEAVLMETVTTSTPDSLPPIAIGRTVGRPTTTPSATPRIPKPKEETTLETLGVRPSKRGEDTTGTVVPGAAPISDLPLSLSELEKRLALIMNKSKTQIAEPVYIPSNRRAFKQFIIQAYRRYKLPAVPNIPDPEACNKLAAASKSDIKSFAYQEFVRDYVQKPSPYRGVLVYHGLGSGKTCTSIISFEALYQAGQKPVFIMTPASLSPNYKDDIINKCGPFIYRANNFWTWVSVPHLRSPTPEAEFLIRRIGIPRASVKKRKGAWIPDPAKSPNFETLAPEHRKQIQEQIYEHLESRLEFIHYNGLTEATIRDWACNSPTKFDGSTVVIDEVHNLVRTINNSGLDVMYNDEPRDMAQYLPKFCAVGRKYRISYLLYRMLCNAVGCKIIALSATPIINFPQEIAVLANLLAGDVRMVEVNTPGMDKRQAILRILEKHPEVDFVEVLPRPELTASTLRITPVPSGYRKVIDPTTGAFRGFVQDDTLIGEPGEIERERDVAAWFERVKLALAPLGLPSFGTPTFRSVTRLPDTEKAFKEMFIDTERLEVKARVRLPLMARLSGLVSYYKGGKADYMARVTLDQSVMVDMSDLQLKKYTEQRKSEIDKELKQKKKPKASTTMYDDVSKNQNSTFKIFSRAACNFVFPADMDRPIPSDYYDTLDMVGAKVPVVSETNTAENGDAPEEGEFGNEVISDAVAEEVVAPAPVVETVPGVGTGKDATAGKTYASELIESVRKLRERSGELFVKPQLETMSPKFQAILDRLTTSRGPALVYSNFKTLEGVGLFSVALEAQLGFRKLDIVPTGGSWSLSPETLTSTAETPRYITYTGDEDRAKRNILLAIFNGKWGKIPAALATQIKEFVKTDNNRSGSIARVFMITQSGAEGISLANVRQVHIMEPYWNYVRLDQVKGRAIRICSHMDLPPEERTVDVFTYVTKFSDRQIKDRLVDETLINFDGGQTTDQNILEICNAKKQLAESIMDTMRTAAVDCELNATENGVLACYRFAGAPSMEPLFHPLVDVHVNEAEAAVRSTIVS